ncbi:4-hydroxybenzoate polyprenyl transferase [Pterulicium gracile]|uniref:4-hydroxybenzoate polyprenyl transferase n=1 Tax=Pterulicium gracile TaxID=1884261 RepID=A0A5C3QEN4_9AGAR|nr:4-hydroxybenzoate polyprenyl transferase [Pterula gracilis]
MPPTESLLSPPTSIHESTPLVKKDGDKKKKNTDFALPMLLTPKCFHPYIELVRLDKPNGFWLMVFPYVIGTTAGAYRAHNSIDWATYGLSLLRGIFSASLIRSAGCAINDITDRDMDAGVERTKNRPMASGRISPRAGYLFLFSLWALGAVAFSFLYAHNRLAFMLVLFQMTPMAWLYPWLKRVTYWPQAWLGLTVHIGMTISFIATSNIVDVPLLAAYLIGGTCWTLLSDTIYACQDREFDLKVGVMSTAILFGTWITPILFTFGTVLVVMLTVVGVLNEQSPIYFVVGVGGAAAQLLWQAATLDLTDPRSCKRNFIRNGQLGWIPSIGLLLDLAVKKGLFSSVF